VPIYEYRCPTCGHEFQKLVYGQRQVACSSCQNPEVHRTPSLFGVRGTSASFAPERSGGSCCSAGGCRCH